MKYLLVLDSSNINLTVGIIADGKVVKETCYEAWQTQSEHMIVEINNLLTDLKISKNDISGVYVCVGPGSYTGVRISITIAKVMGATLNIPVYPVSSLRVLKNGNAPSICLANARSQRSYIGVYKGYETLLEDTIFTNDDVKKYISEHPDYFLCGDLKYLGFADFLPSISENICSLLDNLVAIENVHALKPKYMKD